MPKQDRLMNFGHPTTPWTLKTPLGQQLSNARWFLKL
jgi:hypothetical protein